MHEFVPVPVPDPDPDPDSAVDVEPMNGYLNANEIKIQYGIGIANGIGIA